MFVETKTDGEAQTELEPWQRLLLDAADIMERRGHCKWRLHNDKGEVCFVGALMLAGATEEALMEAHNMMNRYVGESAVSWNNSPRRTGEEVVAGMRECARL